MICSTAFFRNILIVLVHQISQHSYKHSILSSIETYVKCAHVKA